MSWCGGGQIFGLSAEVVHFKCKLICFYYDDCYVEFSSKKCENHAILEDYKAI